jgi:hypothetical protein
MKWLSAIASFGLMVVLTVSSSGCKKGETTTKEGEGGKKLTVTAPGATSIKQGDSQTVTVKIAREKFTEPVEIKFSNLPDKISVVEKDLTIAKDKDEGKFTLKADATAEVVDGKEATVTATGGGITTDAKFKVSVTKAK